MLLLLLPLLLLLLLLLLQHVQRGNQLLSEDRGEGPSAAIPERPMGRHREAVSL